jgi:hypothetical protein
MTANPRGDQRLAGTARSHQPETHDTTPDDRNDGPLAGTGGTATGGRVSPFEDPAVLAEITAILQRGYDRYLAKQRDADHNRERNRDDGRDGRDGGRDGRDAGGDRAA